MIKKFFLNFKIIFYFANFILIILYIFPGSILGWLLYGDVGIQPQISPDFIVSSNHVYAFSVLSILGYLSYKSKKLKLVFIYLFFISIFLELSHLIIPNRGFEYSDLFGNIIGVLIIYIYFQFYKIYSQRNDK
jgi:hypothetical protein|tara:strand:+ start:303 stop:701 length:399 start_codon:yes stop_codon:yes gene_type:complete